MFISLRVCSKQNWSQDSCVKRPKKICYADFTSDVLYALILLPFAITISYMNIHMHACAVHIFPFCPSSFIFPTKKPTNLCSVCSCHTVLLFLLLFVFTFYLYLSPCFPSSSSQRRISVQYKIMYATLTQEVVPHLIN